MDSDFGVGDAQDGKSIGNGSGSLDHTVWKAEELSSRVSERTEASVGADGVTRGAIGGVKVFRESEDCVGWRSRERE